MFVLCPHCQFLVALNPASGQPPPRCPRCERSLREALAAEPGNRLAAAETPLDSPPLEVVDPLVEPDDGAAAATDAVVTNPEAADAPGPGIHDGAEDGGPVATEQVEPSESSAHPESADACAEMLPAPARDAAREVAGGPTLPESSSDSEPDPDTTMAVRHRVVSAARRKPVSTPSFVRPSGLSPAPDPRQRWLEAGAIGALTLLFGLQLLLADRARLAAEARWRPAMTVLCGLLRCTLPPWREPSAFTVLHRDVRSHPTIPGVLRVTAAFRNDARWPQPWPWLLLSLSDLDGRDAGARVFAAREYLGAPVTQSGLASGQTATIAMDVVEPAPRIVAFTFEFR